jgi:hypothetical protein
MKKTKRGATPELMISKEFELRLNYNGLRKGDILSAGAFGKMLIVREPLLQRNVWQKIINFISFGSLYRLKDTYGVKQIIG